jgi:hypothetical protein
MRRVVTIVTVWIAIVLGFATTWTASGPLSRRPRAAEVQSPVEDLVADVRRDDPGATLVVWVGDSTILPLGQWTYPQFVERGFLAPARVETVVRAGPGFTFYQFYCLMSPIAVARPSLVVLVLNLRRMHELPGTNNLLCSRLSPSALLAAGPARRHRDAVPGACGASSSVGPPREQAESFDGVRLSARAVWLTAWSEIPCESDACRSSAGFRARWAMAAERRRARRKRADARRHRASPPDPRGQRGQSS